MVPSKGRNSGFTQQTKEQDETRNVSCCAAS